MSTNLGKRKYPSDERDKQKARYDKWKQAKNTRRGKLEFYYSGDGEKDNLFAKVKAAKSLIGEGQPTTVTTFNLLETVLDFYITQNSKQMTSPEETNNCTAAPFPEYQQISEKSTEDEELFVGAVSSITSLVNQVQHHHKTCTSILSSFNTQKIRHVLQAKIRCDNGHSFTWTSSPHVEGGNFLVNLRMAHGYITSGILPNQFDRLCEASKLGTLGTKYLDTLLDNNETGYASVIEGLACQSVADSLLEEIAAQEYCGSIGGINILTDARHCWRKNAKFSDVVCLGSQTHKVLKLETITKEDDKVSQQHELVGIKRMYEYFDSESVPIILHAHDNNASVTKFVKEERQPTENAKDTWHVTKSITKEARKITSGSVANSGKTWHPELSDKAGSLKTHVYWAMKNCGGDPDKLTSAIDNSVAHYKDKHENCSMTSRCKIDVPYAPSKTIITDTVAEQMFVNFLHKLPVYREPDHYKYCMDTHYVESFNNALLQYHDKRIVFGLRTYKLRLNLAILDWNEHVDRLATSEKTSDEDDNSRRQATVKVLSKKTYHFRQDVWKAWMKKYYVH